MAGFIDSITSEVVRINEKLGLSSRSKRKELEETNPEKARKIRHRQERIVKIGTAGLTAIGAIAAAPAVAGLVSAPAAPAGATATGAGGGLSGFFSNLFGPVTKGAGDLAANELISRLGGQFTPEFLESQVQGLSPELIQSAVDTGALSIPELNRRFEEQGPRITFEAQGPIERLSAPPPVRFDPNILAFGVFAALGLFLLWKGR